MNRSYYIKAFTPTPIPNRVKNFFDICVNSMRYIFNKCSFVGIGVSSLRKRGFTPTPTLASRCFATIKSMRSSLLQNIFHKESDMSQRKTMPKLVSGFTLIEVIVVIGIMATLTVIAYTSFDSAKAINRDQQKVSDIGVIQLSLELFFNQNRQYPMELVDLVPQYLPSLPIPPSQASDPDYQYNYVPLTHDSSGNVCTSYQLWTSFETSNVVLSGKKGFDSTSLPNAGLNICGGGSYNTIDASSGSRVYDILP
jgi:prepilin-type N-terminal cleavage/methylation domain-containing protein